MHFYFGGFKFHIFLSKKGGNCPNKIHFPFSIFALFRNCMLSTKSQPRRTPNAQSHHVVAIENGATYFVLWMQKGCPDSWWYMIHKHMQVMEQNKLKKMFKNSILTHREFISKSFDHLGWGFFTNRPKSKAKKSEPRRNQIF